MLVFKVVDPSSTPRAWHNPPARKNRFERHTHIWTFMPSLDSLLYCAFACDKVIA